MATATAMYHTGRNPLRRLHRTGSEKVFIPKGPKIRRLHKAFLRYHDAANWPLLREALRRMGRRRSHRQPTAPADSVATAPWVGDRRRGARGAPFGRNTRVLKQRRPGAGVTGPGRADFSCRQSS